MSGLLNTTSGTGLALAEETKNAMVHPDHVYVIVDVLGCGWVREICSISVQVLFDDVRSGWMDGYSPPPPNRYVHRMAGQ